MVKRGGRTPALERQRQLATVFELLVQCRDAEPPRRQLTATEVMESLGIGDRRTVRKLFADVAALASQVSLADDGAIHLERETFFHQQLRVNKPLKEAIALCVSELIPSGISLCCSTGTTVAMCVAQLYRAGKYTRLVTNSIGALECLPSKEIMSVELIGGSYNPSINACIGPHVMEAFRVARCQVGLLGISGLTGQGEVFVRHDQEVPVLYEVMRSVESLFLVVDATKLGETDTWQIVDLGHIFQLGEQRLKKIDIVTNDPRRWSLSSEGVRRARATIEAIRGLGIPVEIHEAQPDH